MARLDIAEEPEVHKKEVLGRGFIEVVIIVMATVTIAKSIRV